MYIPPGSSAVTPYFFVEDAKGFVRFLIDGLGGVETCRTMRPNGLIANVQVQLGTSTVMVSEPRIATRQWLAPMNCTSKMPRPQ
jgi:PhnB protein